jgi:DNA polymerase III subunit alpha
MADFVHLHVHSDFSLLDGASSIKTLISRAKELGMKHLALTDHGNMFGALKFYKECKAAEINPIIGSEFYVAPGSRTNKASGEKTTKYYHMILLAKDAEGYRHLSHLSSLSFIEGFYYKPRIDDELLERYHEHLICLSACLGGEIPSLIQSGRLEDAEKKAVYYDTLFGRGSFYLELQDHGIPEQKTVNAALVQISKKTGIPLVATNDLHYCYKEDSAAQDILLCIGTKKKRNEPGRMHFFSPEFYLKSGEEMAALFPDQPEALENTLKIAEACHVEIALPGPKLPDFVIPSTFKDTAEYLRHLTYEGLAKRYGTITDEIRQRADYELGVIIKMDFTGYFLIVWDFINWAKEHGIPVGPGRGSGAGSIVAYSIRITDIDPLRYNLLFERFLNPERISMPDFDVDFCFERRGEVIQYVTEHYGSDRVAQIVTFGTLKAKAVIKDVARVLDIPFDDAQAIAKLVPEDPKMTLAKALELEPRLKAMTQEPRYKELFDISFKLEQKNRQTGIHAAGIVIGQDKLIEFVPLLTDSKTGSVSTQYTMDLIEDCGLVKMDFLGLKTLTLIKHTVDLIRKRVPDFDIVSISDTDKATFKLLGDGKSTGVFQFESEGMQQILKRAKPGCIEDIIALNALYRPGPMAYIDQFIDCKWGRQPIKYPHRDLEPVLKETYGVIVYQEQVMQVAQIIGGYSLGQADLLRRAMGKKKHEVMEKEKVRFIEGAVKKGYAKEKADEIFEILIPFAGYGFNKSHAAAYSVVAYQTAFLKANYPAEFMAANLTNEIASPDKLTEYIDEAKKMGLEIDPPDINRSERFFTVYEGRIVYGLVGVKNAGEGAVDVILKEREANGTFASFMDMLDRVDLKAVNRKMLESLIQAGCFDRMEINRATLFGNLEKALEYAQHKKDNSAFGQVSLFGDSPQEDFPPFVFEQTEDWPQLEKLKSEKELLGFYFSGHPMDKYRKLWEKSCELDLAHPDRSSPDKPYTLIGMLKALRPYSTKNGKQMAFAQIADYKGSIDAVFFPDSWEKLRDRLSIDDVVCLLGKVDHSRQTPSFLVEKMLDPDDVKAKSVDAVHVRFRETSLTEDTLAPIQDAVFDNPGTCAIFFHIKGTGPEKIVKASPQISVASTDDVLTRLRSIPIVLDAWKE